MSKAGAHDLHTDLIRAVSARVPGIQTHRFWRAFAKHAARVQPDLWGEGALTEREHYEIAKAEGGAQIPDLWQFAADFHLELWEVCNRQHPQSAVDKWIDFACAVDFYASLEAPWAVDVIVVDANLTCTRHKLLHDAAVSIFSLREAA